MYRRLSFIAVCLVTSFFFVSCEKEKQFGSLRVNGTKDGNYEIYKTTGENLSQITSEQIGKYNTDQLVEAGSYLVLADCSHAEIVINPNESKVLVAHELIFNPPHPISDDDLFSIQCTKFEKLQFRQLLKKQLSLQILTGKHSLLVGMKSIHVDFSGDKFLTPQKKVLNLGAVSVSSPIEKINSTPYFVSPKKSMVAITQPQNFNSWQYLLPGDYELSLNGSKTDVSIVEGLAQSIEPALIKIESPPYVELSIATKIRGKPINFTINGEHILELNEVYPMLPGVLTSQLDGSHIKQELVLESGVLTSIALRSLTVDLGCSPWDWTCLGSKEVLLFQNDEHYPFTENTTDIPILFAEEEVIVGLLGSHGIRYKLPKGPNLKLKAGFVKIIPSPIHVPGQLTDLVRLEALNNGFSGHTLDITPDKSTTLTLLEGNYALAQYNASTILEGDRRLVKRNIKIIPGETVYLRFPYYVSERRLKRINGLNLKETKRVAKSRSKGFRHARREKQY